VPDDVRTLQAGSSVFGGYKGGTELPLGIVRRMLGHVSCSQQSCRGLTPEPTHAV